MKLNFIKSTDGSSAAFQVSRAQNQKVEGYGTLTGSGIFGLTQTDDTGATVFNVGNNSSSSKLVMDSSDANYCFTGTNFDVTFDKKNASGYNVELNTANSVFDFSGSNSCAFVWNNGSNTTVNLGSTSNNYLGVDYFDSGDGTSTYAKVYNNIVYDNGTYNTYNSNATSVTRFQTLDNSYGAAVNGSGNDAFFIGGALGSFNGLNENNTLGFNYINTLATSAGNTFTGGLGENIYNDYGICNMFMGAGYANYLAGEEVSLPSTTSNYINFNGYGGLAAFLGEGVINYNGGSYNTGFHNTAEATDTEGNTYNFASLLSGTYNNLMSLFATEE